MIMLWTKLKELHDTEQCYIGCCFMCLYLCVCTFVSLRKGNIWIIPSKRKGRGPFRYFWKLTIEEQQKKNQIYLEQPEHRRMIRHEVRELASSGTCAVNGRELAQKVISTCMGGALADGLLVKHELPHPSRCAYTVAGCLQQHPTLCYQESKSLRVNIVKIWLEVRPR